MANIGRSKLFVAIVVLAWLCSSLPALGESVDLAKAQKATDAFLASRSTRPGRGTTGTIRAQAAGVTPAGFRTVRDANGTILAYVADLDPRGFVALSADTDIAPVIAYSFNASFPASSDAANPLVRMLRADMQLRTKALAEHPELKTAETAEQWNLLATGDPNDANDGSFQQWPLENTTSTGGWLETVWVQGDPYNLFCPKDPVDGVRSYVGCVATAFAQLVHYHRLCEASFTQDDSYTTTNGIQVDADSGLYDFPSFETLDGYLDTIRLKYSQGADLNDTDIAALNLACGAAVEMDYGSDGSGASLYAVQTALLDRFGHYSADMYGGLTGDALVTLRENVANGLPALLSFSPPDGWGGHVIVCDGYNTAGEYHLNFGWGATFPQEVTEAWYALPTAFLYKDCVITESILNVQAAQPEVEVDASSLSFYAAPGEQSSAKALRIKNNVANLRIASISCPEGFVIDRGGNGYGRQIDPFVIETPGQGASINVAFKPAKAGGYYGMLVIHRGDGGTKSVILEGLAYGGGTTIASGPVSGTWSADESPYFVTGNIEIAANGRLVMEPGVKVLFMGPYGLTVGRQAKLLAEGSEAQPVEFTAWNLETGWTGLRFVDSGSDDYLSYCRISCAKKDAGLVPQDGSSTVTDADSLGGAVYCEASDPIIGNCVIANNMGKVAGAIYCTDSYPLVMNTVIANNTAVGGTAQCGGILCDAYGAPQIYNCTIVNNFPGAILSSSWDGITVVNTIVWGNDRYQIYMDECAPTIAFCDIQGGYRGEGNIDRDPCFLDPTEGVGTDYDGTSANWALASDSPCINAGTQVGDLPMTDPAGGGRVFSDVIDIGAYENQSDLPLLTVTPSNTVDAGCVAVQGSEIVTIELANTGRLDFEIVDLQIADEAFSVATPIQNRLLSQGKSLEVQIAFNPTQERIYTGTLRVHSTGSNASAMPISLRGVGVMGTPVPAGSVSGIWKKTSSPYVVTGDISIPRNQTLTIEPGVTVKFAGHFGLTVGYRATLLARGTEDDGIVFAAIDPNEGWFGIRFINSSSEDALQYCTLEHARKPRTGGGSFEDLFGGAILCYGSYEHDPGMPVITSPIIDSCVIAHNYARTGGAIMCYNGAMPTITNNVIVDNEADYDGGGITAYYADCTIANNVIARNGALVGGGIMSWRSVPVIRNNTVVANRPSAMHLESTLIPGWPVIAASVVNNIVWQNEVLLTDDVTDGEYDIRHNDIQGGSDGVGNLDVDPLFADAENDDYHLKSQAGRWDPAAAAWVADDVTSPCIDAGNPATSYSKEPQPNGQRVNMGAYGGTAQASKSP